MNKLPIKISPSPIIEATVELKFSTQLPNEAVFGLLYNAVKDNFGKMERLPTTLLPIEVMRKDPNLKYKALYKLTDGTFNAQIGYDVITFHSPNQYVGWEYFLKNILLFFNKVKSSGVISKPESLLLRYVNFFESNIYEQINLQIQLFNQSHNSNNLVLRTEFMEENFIEILQIANNVTVSNDSKQRKGSLVDIICAYNHTDNLLIDFENIISKAHYLEKKLFFGLLKPEFLNTLNPEYSHE